MPNDNLNKLHAWEMIKVVQDVVILQLAKQAEAVTARSDIDPNRLIDDPKFRKQIALENKATGSVIRATADHKMFDLGTIPIHLLPNKSEHELFAQQVDHLSSDNKYDLTIMHNDFTEEHVMKVMSVINASLAVTEQWSKPDGSIVHHRFAQLIHALLLIFNFREKNNMHDLVFRDANHYFVGRLHEWQKAITQEQQSASNVDATQADVTNGDAKLLDQIAALLRRSHQISPPGNRYWGCFGALHYFEQDAVVNSRYKIVDKLVEEEVIIVAKNSELKQKVIDSRNNHNAERCTKNDNES